jgi:broad specificity phosphatase PhoE
MIRRIAPTLMAQKIVLVRHGRSGHVHSGWINAAELHGWRDAYEAAGIHADDVPPPELCADASAAGVLAASTARRAIESAKLLAPARDLITSPLLVELELHPPALGPIRLPLPVWALMYGVRWLMRATLHRPHVTTAEEQRARDAAEWLSRLAADHGSVMAVTHGMFRGLVARELVKRGWLRESSGRKSHHWSVWRFARP